MIRRLPFSVANLIIRCVPRHLFISFAIANGDLKVSMALELIKSLIAGSLVGRGFRCWKSSVWLVGVDFGRVFLGLL